MDNSTYDVGSAATTPREIRELRRHNLEFHHRLGNPVIFKRRKTLQDVENGTAVRCPYNYDTAYHSDISTCPYCFGTGILGGFDSGIIVFVTIGDAVTDQFQLSPQGLLTRMTHPQWTAPWKPQMHDGDLIILANFDPDTYAVVSTDDRFEIDQVTPVTPEEEPRSDLLRIEIVMLSTSSPSRTCSYHRAFEPTFCPRVTPGTTYRSPSPILRPTRPSHRHLRAPIQTISILFRRPLERSLWS
jgi:hypothetical protein